MAKLFCAKYLDYVLNEIFKHIDRSNTVVIQSLRVNQFVNVNDLVVKNIIIDSYQRHFSGLREAYKYLELSINQSLFAEKESLKLVPK